MTDAGVEVALPSIEPDVAAPLLNRGNGAGNEGEMPSHSTVEFNDGLTLRVRMSSNGHTFSVLTRQSSRCDEKSNLQGLEDLFLCRLVLLFVFKY